jgi:hypothetical protein
MFPQFSVRRELSHIIKAAAYDTVMSRQAIIKASMVALTSSKWWLYFFSGCN